MLTEIERYSVDWGDLNKAHLQNSRFLRDLAADKATLGVLLDRVKADPGLWDMCEHNRLFDKLVLHDAPDRGFRIRMHRWSDVEMAAAHDHRWSFTTLLLTGGYEHACYDVIEAPDDTDQPGPEFSGARMEVTEKFRTTQRAGDSYTIHHTVVHATFTLAHTITLLLRGPAEKSRSRRTQPETGKIWYGFGREDQTAEQIAKRRLSTDQYDVIRAEISEYGLI